MEVNTTTIRLALEHFFYSQDAETSRWFIDRLMSCLALYIGAFWAQILSESWGCMV